MKAASHSFLRLDPDSPGMRLDDSSDDREAEARAAQRPRHLVVSVKDAWDLRRRDPSSSVFHRDSQLLSSLTDCHMDPALRRSELDGVREQIGEGLLDSALVAQHLGWR